MQNQTITAASEIKPNSGLDSALVGGVQTQAQMKTETKLQQFKRFRTLKELKAACKNRGWKVDTGRFDEVGSDYVRVDFDTDTASGMALVSMVNGRFFGELNTGEAFSGSSNKHEGCDWFQALLETVYTND